MMRLLKLVPDNTNIDFIRWRFVAMGLSILLMLASVGVVAAKGFNLGIDFVGGQMIRAHFSQDVPIDQLRSRINGLGLGEATIQQFGSPREVAIRMPLPPGDAEAANLAAEKVKQAVLASFPGTRFDAVETVSGKVSKELFSTGAWAIALSMIGIAIYIWLRFEWQFGVGALFALLHDVVLTLGLFSITRLEFNLNVVAAILTIVGYSLNDTIVVYDRVRENLRKYRKMELPALLNLTVNETLARTIVTSFSMIIALAVLVWIGPDMIFGLAAAILFGIVIGTFSSIYVANPILIWLRVGPDSFLPPEAKGGAERVGPGA